MATGGEDAAIESWIRSTLTADGTLTAIVPAARMSAHPAEQGTVWPVVTWQWQGGVDVTEVAGARVLVRNQWLIRVIHNEDTPLASAVSAVERIDTLLQGVDGTSGGVTFACRRARSFQQTELEEGRRFTHRGGIYRFDFHPVAV